MKSLINIVAVIAILWPSAVWAQTKSEDQISIREMYVACYLLANDVDLPIAADQSTQRYNPLHCLLGAARTRSVVSEGKATNICFPRDARFATNPTHELALAYIEFFEGALNTLSKVGGASAGDPKGYDAMILAASIKWRC